MDRSIDGRASFVRGVHESDAVRATWSGAIVTLDEIDATFGVVSQHIRGNTVNFDFSKVS